jgi:hypothetical protein
VKGQYGGRGVHRPSQAAEWRCHNLAEDGQQSVRGRKERIEFADSFKTIVHFSNLYMSGTSYFPIMWSMTKLKASDLSLSDEEENDGVEGECDNEVVEVVDTQMTTMSK